ncbi:MAG: FKBP-type peptidyl-prolyl cis-trans isomerase [Bacteroidales bacterium]|nr:peptidylprolyl isomerase [Bacteroidales bacterium]MBR3609286.1 FKBP-type peptidyl-prolyl cis-trans isomerase [Bacteroidales bacterium]
MDIIKDGKYVEACYVLTVGVEEEVMETVPKNRPLSFIFGADQMLEAFENNVAGLKAGDKFDFRIASADAFGEYEEQRVQELSKEIFSPNGEFDAENVVPGKTFQMINSDGDRFNGSVLEVRENTVIMDFNHPLAGEELHFVGEVLLVRDATEEELNPKHSCGGCSGCHGGDCGDGNCSGCGC